MISGLYTSAQPQNDFDAWCAESPVGRWFVLHVRSRQEKALSEALESRGVAHFLPLMRQWRYYGRRKVSVELPLFPGYLFLRGEVEDAWEADRTRRVASIISVSDQGGLQTELRHLHLALSQDAVLDAYPFLQAGVRVQVRSGPFRGIQGVIESRKRRDRLVLQISALGKAVSLEVDGALLEVIEA